MATVKGVVAATSNKFDKFSVCIDEKWYSTKFPPSPEPGRGDEVEFEDGGKNFIQRLRIVGKGSGTPTPTTSTGGRPMARGTFPVDPLDGSRSIIRQNAMARAVDLVLATEASSHPDAEALARRVIEVSMILERYSAGDMDREEAEALASKVA